MIADMTGPNGGFIPISQAQQVGRYQPLQQSDGGEAMEMRQQQSRTQPGYDYQPVQQGDVEEQLSSEEGIQGRYEPAAPGPLIAESSSAAVRRGKQRGVSGPNQEIHPALRNDADVISHAI